MGIKYGNNIKPVEAGGETRENWQWNELFEVEFKSGVFDMGLDLSNRHFYANKPYVYLASYTAWVSTSDEGNEYINVRKGGFTSDYSGSDGV